jgi:hypothetical protein
MSRLVGPSPGGEAIPLQVGAAQEQLDTSKNLRADAV